MKANLLTLGIAILCVSFFATQHANAQTIESESRKVKSNVTKPDLSRGTQKILLKNENISENENADKPLAIGDFAHGGIIIYLDETGEHGLVCAKTNSHADVLWSKGYLINVGANKDCIYGGIDNTAAIVNELGTFDNAGTVCNNWETTENGVTYNDWYLPSKTEMSLISQNLDNINSTAIANGGTAILGTFWSSTENKAYAWSRSFNSDNTTFEREEYKTNTRGVRAIRRF